MKLVVDASVALKWYLNHREAEQDVEHAAADGADAQQADLDCFHSDVRFL